MRKMLKSRDFSRNKYASSFSEGVATAVSSIFVGLKKGSHKILPAMILAVAVSATGATFDFAPTFAASGSLSDLDKMELKFFHHTYPKEDQGERLDRLEKMFFGEAKEGPTNERFNKLKELVPDLDQVQAPEPATPGKNTNNATAGGGRSSGRGTSNTASNSSNAAQPDDDRPDEGTAYPAITAIEQRKLGKTFESEPVGDRLARLEKKVFGHASDSNDFTDRMDRLKSATGVDIARQAPPGTEWGEDEVDVDYPTPSENLPRQTVRRPTYSQGEDGRSFSGRDLREDMRRAFGNRYPGSSASGSYGMNGGSASSGSGSSGSYGFGSGSSSSTGAGVGSGVGLIPNDRSTTAYAPPSSSAGGYPPTAPPIQRSTSSKPLGLNQQVDLLEGQIFGHSYSSDTLPDRVARLEKTIFPSQNVSSNLGLPARVARLTSVVPISNSGNMISSAPAPAPPYSGNQGYPSNQNDPRARPRGGLSKILNSMGNFVGGGFSVGSYPMNGNLVTDPQTGLYLDRATGNLIDPSTGMVVGRRGVSGYGNVAPGYGNVSPGYGNVSPGYGYRSFNNGFAPSITPYNYGVGGTGIRFGTGYGTGFGTGFGGVGGMWP